jgi:hypothetical protein
MSRLGLSIQWVPVLAPGYISQGMNLIIYLTYCHSCVQMMWTAAVHPCLSVCIHCTHRDSLLYKWYTTNSARGTQWSCDCVSWWYVHSISFKTHVARRCKQAHCRHTARALHPLAICKISKTNTVTKSELLSNAYPNDIHTGIAKVWCQSEEIVEAFLYVDWPMCVTSKGFQQLPFRSDTGHLPSDCCQYYALKCLNLWK